MFFDAIEEKRVLDAREFIFGLKIRAQAYELARIVEIRWMQRSRITWLKNGNKNTRYFHAYASARTRKNAVTSIQYEGRECFNKEEITDAFAAHTRKVLGSDVEVLNFDPKNCTPR